MAAEVRRALELFPQAQEIFFDDDTFTADGERAQQIAKALAPYKCTWSATARATTSYETLKAMKEGGLRLLVIGYESGNSQILKNMQKGATPELARRITKWCKELGIQIHGAFMVGLAGGNAGHSGRIHAFCLRTGPGYDPGLFGHAVSGHGIL